MRNLRLAPRRAWTLAALVVGVVLVVPGSAMAANPLSFSPTTLFFSQAGTPNVLPATIKSSTGAVSVTLSSSASWLTLSTTSGTTPLSFNATVNPSGLTAGVKTATITAKSGGNSKKMTVTYVVGCGPLACNQVRVSAPYNLDFNSGEGGILDASGVGTGFTYLEQPVNGTGYIPSNLHVTGGQLSINTTAGTNMNKTNAQDNELGVGVFNPIAQTDLVSATVVNPPAGTGHNEQAGVWFGMNQDNYVKLVVISTGAPTPATKIQLLMETNAKAGSAKNSGTMTLSGSSVRLTLSGDPSTHVVTATYAINGGAPKVLGSRTVPVEFFSPDQAGIDPSIGTRSFMGILASNGTGPATTYQFDDFAQTAGNQVGQGGVWETKSPMPASILDAGSTAVGGKLYSIAGKNSSSVHLSTMYVYNPSTDSWSTGPNLPGPAVENPAVTNLNGKVYVFGGSTSAFSGAVNNAAVYDPSTNAWTQLAAMPTARGGPTAQALGGKIYVMGGMDSNGQSLNTVEIYDPSTNQWSTGSPLQTPRDNPGSAVLNGAIYVFGGRQELDSKTVVNGTLQSVERLDPTGSGIGFSRTTIPLNDSPTAMAWGPDGRLYVATCLKCLTGVGTTGTIHAFTINASHQVTNDQVISVLANEQNASGTGRLTLGLAFDPSSTAQNMKLWVADSDPDLTNNAPLDSSRVDYLLSSENFATVHHAITGLPRSASNHSLNALHFGPDGRLYMTEASETAAGAANNAGTEFGTGTEQPLSAAVLVADVDSPTFTPGSCSNTQNPTGPPPSTCPVSVWATGLRNTYDFVWADNGKMYGPNNGVGITASYPPSPTPPCTGLGDTTSYKTGGDNPGTQPDYLNLIQQGKYYGHPDPYRIDPNGPECVFGDGHFQGVSPLPNYKPPIANFGNDRSADGIIQYHGNAFGGQLDGHLLVTEYATGQDVVNVTLSPDGQSVTSVSTLAANFTDPLPISEGPDGSIYVGEFGSGANHPPRITILTPSSTAGSGSWSYVAPMPTGRRTMAVGLLNGNAQLMGGERTSSGGAFSANEEYNPVTDTWRTLAPMQTPRQGAAYGTINGEVYVAGGGTTGGLSTSNIVEGFHF